MIRIQLDDATRYERQSLRRTARPPPARDRLEIVLLFEAGWSPPRRPPAPLPPDRPQGPARLPAARAARLLPGPSRASPQRRTPRPDPRFAPRPARAGAHLDLRATGRGPSAARPRAGRPPGAPLPRAAACRLPPHRLDPGAQAGPGEGRARHDRPGRWKKQAQAGRLQLYYLDESGFSPSLPTGYRWCLPGQRQRVKYEYPPGRRAHVWAAYASSGASALAGRAALRADADQ